LSHIIYEAPRVDFVTHYFAVNSIELNIIIMFRCIEYGLPLPWDEEGVTTLLIKMIGKYFWTYFFEHAMRLKILRSGIIIKLSLLLLFLFDYCFAFLCYHNHLFVIFFIFLIIISIWLVWKIILIHLLEANQLIKLNIITLIDSARDEKLKEREKERSNTIESSGSRSPSNNNTNNNSMKYVHICI
jgi:fatty acid desaturase